MPPSPSSPFSRAVTKATAFVHRALPERKGRLHPAQNPVQHLEEMPPARTERPANPVAHLLRRRAEQLLHPHAARIARLRAQRHQHQQRGGDGARPVRDLVQMEREPARQQHDLHRHHRHAAPRHLAEQRQLRPGEDIAAFGPAGAQNRLAGSPHMRGLRVVADDLQREIRLHAGRQIERAIMEQRPTAMRGLGGAQIVADLALQIGVDPVQKMLEQHVFGRDGRVRLKLEHPVPVGALMPPQRRAGAVDGVIHYFIAGRVRYVARHHPGSVGASLGHCAPSKFAAVRPDLMAPSMVAGNPVAVQSPARTRLASPVRACGRRPLLRRICREGSAFFLHHPHRWHRIGQAQRRAHIGPDPRGNRLRRQIDQPVGGADRDGDDAVLHEDPLRRAPDHADKPGRAGIGGHAEVNVENGFERIRRHQSGQQIGRPPRAARPAPPPRPAATGTDPSGASRRRHPVALDPQCRDAAACHAPRRHAPPATPRPDRPGFRTVLRAETAECRPPPRASASHPPRRPANAPVRSPAGVFSAATASGSSRRRYSVPAPPSTSATVTSGPARRSAISRR